MEGTDDQAAHGTGAAGIAPADYFTGAGYGRALEALLQVADHPGTVATVIGARQSGKTALCRALARVIDPSLPLLRINGNLTGSVEDLEARLRQVAGAESPRVLVDDAHRLPTQCLQHLLQQAAEARLVLFLFGTRRLRLRTRNRSAHVLPGQLRIDLPDLAADERRAYLNWFLSTRVPAAADQHGSREVTVHLGVRHSRPGAIEAAALRRLGYASPIAGARKPMLTLTLATFGLVMVGALLVLGTADRPMVATSKPDGPPPGDTPIRAPVSIVSDPPAIDLDAAPQHTTRGELVPEDPAPALAPADTLDDAHTAVEATDDATPDTTEPAETETIGIDRHLPTPSATAPEEIADTPEPSPDAAVRRSVIGSATGTTDSSSWVLAQPAGHYTLQIAVVSSAERAAAFIRQQPNADGYVTYPVRVATETRQAILFGSYASRSEAERAAAALPRAAGTSAPWIRRFSEVQAAARAGAE